MPKKPLTFINGKIGVLLFLLSLSLETHASNGENLSSTRSEVTNDIVSGLEVDHAIRLAADYLKRNCGATGKFMYLVNDETHQESSKYDIIRHAGAIYGLAMFNDYEADSDSVYAMVRAGRLMRNYMDQRPKPDHKMLIVWMSPTTSLQPMSTDLGANGLGLVALAEINKVQPQWTSVDDLKAMGQFIIYLQKNNGSFFHRYRDQKGPVLNWECLYYPGEAACGLISLYEADHSEQWLTAAAKALSYLAKSRDGIQNVPDDHWALIATARLWPYYDQVKCPVSREELVRQAVQICKGMLSDQITNASDPNFDGGFDPDGGTTPSATRLEGLLAALEFLPPNQSELKSRIEACVRKGINFLLRAQIKSGEYAGGIPAVIPRSTSDALVTRLPENIRIDYVQHALCAMIRYQKLFPPQIK